MEKKLKRFLKIYPWFHALSGDLLFYVAIGSLFLTVEKDLSTAQIVSLTTVSSFVSIAMQFPILWIIKRIGNSASVKVSGIFLLLSSVLVTFGPSYIFIALGLCFRHIAITFREISVIVLENNLELVDRKGDFVNYRAMGTSLYSIITMIISFVASLMFNIHHYFPMICCVLSTVAATVTSFFINDYSDYNKINKTESKSSRSKIQWSKLIVLVIIFNALFYSLVDSGQSDQKLLIQEELFKNFNVANTALILGVILAFSRITRVVSNLFLVKLYKRVGNRIGNILSLLMVLSFALSISVTFVPNLLIKFIVMTVGYVIILFARDPFAIFIQDVMINNTPKEQHPTLLATMRFCIRVATALTSAVYTALLLEWPLVAVIGIMCALAVVTAFVGFMLYRSLKQKESTAPIKE